MPGPVGRSDVAEVGADGVDGVRPPQAGGETSAVLIRVRASIWIEYHKYHSKSRRPIQPQYHKYSMFPLQPHRVLARALAFRAHQPLLPLNALAHIWVHVCPACLRFAGFPVPLRVIVPLHISHI